MSLEFRPRRLNKPVDEIIPRKEIGDNIDDALDEIEPVVDELSKDISGVGQKAAERYLLRHEYGMEINELANEFGVAPQTVSNQVSEVRTKVLKYPRLARIIGTLRSHRADLSEPDLEDGQSWDGETVLNGEVIQYNVEFKTGTVGRPYSWCYSCESRYEQGTKVHHLFEDYLIDAIHGVMLKRLMRGISFSSWVRPPMGKSYTYRAFALPNAEIPNDREGSLLDAVEYHWAYDTKNHLEPLLKSDTDKTDLEHRAEHGDVSREGSADYTREDVLSHRIRNHEEPNETIENHDETVHVRNNIERILRTYPLDSPFDLPAETVTQLWNGQPSDRDDYSKTWLINKGPLYSLTKDAHGRHRGRDIRITGTRHTVKLSTWLEAEVEKQSGKNSL